MARRGKARPGEARQARRGLARQGGARHGRARQARQIVNTVVEIALEISSAASRFAEQVKKHSYHGHPLDVAGVQDNLNAIIEAVAKAAEWLDEEVDNQDDAQADQRVGSAGR